MIVIKLDRRGLRLGDSSFALYERKGDAPSTLFGYAEITIRDYEGQSNGMCTLFDVDRRPILSTPVTVADGSPSGLARAVRKAIAELHPDEAIIVE